MFIQIETERQHPLKRKDLFIYLLQEFIFIYFFIGSIFNYNKIGCNYFLTHIEFSFAANFF